MADNTESGRDGQDENLDPTELEEFIEFEDISVQAEGAGIWTVSELEEAIPIPMPEVGESTLTEMEEDYGKDMDSVGLLGSGGLESGGMPDIQSDDDLDTLATTGGYNYPGPYTSYQVPSNISKLYPYRTIGKIYFKQNGRSYVGSASSVGGRGIWTAGHCAHAGNGKRSGWSTNMIFVPALHNATKPYNQWKVTWLTTTLAWYTNGNPGGLYRDFAGGATQNIGGKKLSQRIGWLGFAWNWSRFQHWNGFGYPAAAPFDGKKMWSNQASYAYNGSVSGSPKPLAIGCNLTGGCSGGPWVLKFGSGNYVNGLFSYRRRSKPEEICSPYLDTSAKNLKDKIVKK